MNTRHPTLIALLVGTLAARGEGQSTARPISHWHHTAWTGDAAPPPRGELLMLRSPDGYIWMNGIGCLIRFDGVRFTVFDSTTTPALRSSTLGTFAANVVDRSGVMWVRGPGGLVLAYRDGQFRVVMRARPSVSNRMIEDGLGRLWLHTDRFQLLQDDRLAPAPMPPGLPTDIIGFDRDTGSGLWVGTRTQGVWHIVGNSARQYGTGRIRALLQSRDGAVWAIGEGLGRGLWRLAGESWSEVRLPNEPDQHVTARSGVEGADGSIWFPTPDMGVLRWRDGVLEQFSKQDGLSNNRVRDVLVDADGAVWATTDAGLDRLRPSTFVPIERANGLPFDAGYLFAEDTSGAVWASAPGGVTIHLLDGGAIRGRPGLVASTPYAPTGNRPHMLLTASRHGGVWVAPLSGGGLVHLRKDGARAFGSDAGLPNARWVKATETRDGTLWVSTLGGALGRLRNGRYRAISIASSEHSAINVLFADNAGRLWVAGDRRVLRVLDGAGDSIVAEVPLPDSVGSTVRALATQGADTLWALTRTSLLRIANRRVAEVRLPWLTYDPAGSANIAILGKHLWLASGAGIVQLLLSHLERAANGDSVTIVPKVFGALDGLSVPRTPSLTPVVMRVGKEGRVWIATPNGLAFADSADQTVNATPPRVHIEELQIGGSVVALDDGETIGPNPNRIDVRFTAISAVLPERVRLQYRLDGADERWIDDNGPRVASYTQLRPGKYRFRARAWNEDGVPSVGEATLNFRVLPAWYQAWWFFALMIVAVASMSGGAVAAVQRRRGQRAARDAQTRFDAVLSERTRMARELHDTLLQGFTGITLQLDSVRNALKARSEPSANRLGDILLLADRTLREARDMVWDIREPGSNTDDLAESLLAASREIPQPGGIEFRHSVDGVRRQLPPVVGATILRIAKEALVNAVRHAKPSSIIVQLIYEPRRVQLEIADDGIGSDPAAFDMATARGHWGVAGMHERARAAGGAVVVTSAPGQGTRVSVSLPAEPIP